jgi:hypothetical protein
MIFHFELRYAQMGIPRCIGVELYEGLLGIWRGR